jgi:hypothetical protein
MRVGSWRHSIKPSDVIATLLLISTPLIFAHVVSTALLELRDEAAQSLEACHELVRRTAACQAQQPPHKEDVFFSSADHAAESATDHPEEDDTHPTGHDEQDELDPLPIATIVLIVGGGVVALCAAGVWVLLGVSMLSAGSPATIASTLGTIGATWGKLLGTVAEKRKEVTKKVNSVKAQVSKSIVLAGEAATDVSATQQKAVGPRRRLSEPYPEPQQKGGELLDKGKQQ